MNDRAVQLLLRSVAVLIAMAALIDPAVTSRRVARPLVTVASESANDSAVVAAVSRKLSHDFTVLTSPFANAAAEVVVGSRIPAAETGSANTSVPNFVVVPHHADGHVALSELDVPTRAPLSARVPITAALNVRGGEGRTVEAELVANGAVVDRTSQLVNADDTVLKLPLSFVPTVAGPVRLHISTRIAGAVQSSDGDRVIDVVDRKWAVLVFDARPSWMSTFVRRALERDSRFVVTSRTVTSTGVSTDAGRPPAMLGDATALDGYDAILVGAPEAVSERDVEGLNQFLRRRGGGVALLFDDRKDGRYSALIGGSSWTGATGSTPTVIAGNETDSVAMRATEWMWPTRTPVSATVLAWNSNAGVREHPMVWQMPVGAGRLLVNGALDAWKFRDPAQSSFERFWQTSIGELADASVAAVALRVPSVPVKSGSRVHIAVMSRPASLAPLTAIQPVQSSASAQLRINGRSQFVRVWPEGSAGAFSGSFRAPDSAGVYRVSATADGATTDASIVVSDRVSELTAPNDSAALSAWAGSTGGRVLSESRLNELPASLQKALKRNVQRVEWYPMRSAWWLLPFVFTLGAEWWLRRRRGLA